VTDAAGRPGAPGRPGAHGRPDVSGRPDAPADPHAEDRAADLAAAAQPTPIAALRVLRLLAVRLREGRRRIDDRAWRAWLTTIAVGTAGMLLLMVLLMLAARQLERTGALAGEAAVLRWIDAHSPIGFSSAVFFQTFGSDITLAILVGATAALAAWLRRPITMFSLILAPVVPDMIGRFGWLIWDRARPTVLHEGIASPAFNAFPSGHTSKTFATYGLLAIIWIGASRSLPERAVALLLLTFIALVVPLGRMTMGVHWPSDVIAGLILGAAWLAVLTLARRHEPPSP
jgi:membrane-associated phospholipid phosphatase